MAKRRQANGNGKTKLPDDSVFMYLYEKYKLQGLVVWVMICVYLLGVNVGVKFPVLFIMVAIGVVVLLLVPTVRYETCATLDEINRLMILSLERAMGLFLSAFVETAKVFYLVNFRVFCDIRDVFLDLPRKLITTIIDSPAIMELVIVPDPTNARRSQSRHRSRRDVSHR
ncbi:hypothetical protein NP493_834g01016 [Ridgeia piscesae]|uniref:Uncharacterized protein n=1 Tax=Ridgeia piscesae TaxID=27915 RepID=A0AAD9KM01_RIDPI|nr:hypothetical protein NP493_834g01016 [Ridgeia piscesae]